MGAAIGITAGAPMLGNPVLSSSANEQALIAVGITTSSSLVGSPILTEIAAGVISPLGIAAAPPILADPVLKQAHVLSAGAIAAGGPVFGQVSLAQQHVMMAGELTTGNAQLFKPVLTPGGTDIYISPVLRYSVAAESRRYTIHAEHRNYTISQERQ